MNHHTTAAGYTTRKFCYKTHCHLDVPVTVMLGRVNEASAPRTAELRHNANVSGEGNERTLLL
jgi:hypothetical protein